MTADLTGLCRDHSFETAQDICRRCGSEYCELCLVFPFGASKPLCKECAMVAGGVRAHGACAAMGKRDLKKKVKAFKQRLEADRDRGTAAETVDVIDPTLQDPVTPTILEQPVTVPDIGAAAAADLAVEFSTEPPAPLSSSEPTPHGPADGVAPPIDWSQPFG